MGSKTIDFGIDLGTTNSSIAVCRGGEVKLTQTTEMMTVTPSVVYIGKSGRMLVGKRAYDTWPTDPENTQAEFKRWMGFSDKLLFPSSNRQMSAEELSAEVLKAMRADVRRTTGEDVTSAVITVPAAFGALQCEATGRAAKMAGFLEAPLLQEPIAAAIAYGAVVGGKAQRWMVFDLGGGTLDIAIVSTRNGRLAVLEHQGNNRLGGKDIDRAIVEQMLLPPLAGQFKLPDRAQQPAQYDRLFRNLVRVAEQAKIGLSTAETMPVDIFNLGEDLAGAPIEATLELKRAEMEQHMQPLLEECLKLVERALEGARVRAEEIDKVLMVGGPTQMPVVRAALIRALGDKLDYSIDPMTVVAQGAALYASTLERTVMEAEAGSEKRAAAEAPTGTVAIKLNHERASGSLKSPVAGVLPAGSGLHEVKIDAAGGVWSSGWVAVNKDRFGVEVMLAEGKPVTRFLISGRTTSGSEVKVSPAEFTIAFMLPMGAPPLPHTVAIEIESCDGKEHFDEIFRRHTPLPAEARRTYRANRTLRPSELDSTLPIKFWEIAVSEDPSEKWWAGSVHIRAEKLKRPLNEGTEIELTIKIDKSRKMTVDVFVPLLNQGFSGDVFVPDPPTTRNQLQQQLDLCFGRVNKLFELLYAGERDDLREDVETLQVKLEMVAEKVTEEEARGNRDPDALLGPVEMLRKIRVLLAQLEAQLESERKQGPEVIKLRASLHWTAQLVRDHGTDADKQALSRLTAQFERYVESGDQRGLKYLAEQIHGVRWPILREQRWYFESQLAWHRQPGHHFVNQEQAAQAITEADRAKERNDFPGLREAIFRLWSLLPPDQVEAAKEQAMQSGLKGG